MKSIFYDKRSSKVQINGDTLTQILANDAATRVNKKSRASGRPMSSTMDKKTQGLMSPLLNNINKEVSKELQSLASSKTASVKSKGQLSRKTKSLHRNQAPEFLST